jgi:hypothetical protein
VSIQSRDPHDATTGDDIIEWRRIGPDSHIPDMQCAIRIG